MPYHKSWVQPFIVPQKGHIIVNVRCPECQAVFQVKVCSKAKARRKKIFFASCFLAIAGGATVLGLYAGKRKGFMALSLAAPFVFFGLWQLLNALRGRLDPSDIITHARGKVHRIFDDHKISVSQQ